MAQSDQSKNSHDKFFKHLLSKESRAKSFLKGILPDNIQKMLNWDSLALTSESYIDEKLRATMADIVYTCQVAGETVYVTFLFEHKSYVPQYPHVQLLRYMLNFWERQAEAGAGLYPIIPIVMYHGLNKWKEGDFSDFIFGITPALRVFVPDFSYMLLNVRDEEDEDLEEIFREDIILLRGLVLMKHIFDEDLSDRLQQILLELIDPRKSQAYKKIFRTFVVYAGNYITEENELKLEEIMTLEEELDYYGVPEDHWLRGWFDRLREKIIAKDKERAKIEGRAEGLAEGLAEGKTKGLQLAFRISGLYQKEVPIPEIAIQLKITEEEVTEILKNLGLVE